MHIAPQKTGCDRPPDSTARNEFRNLTQGRPQPSPPNVAGVARERRVLLIDDDPDLADLYLMQLRRDGIPLEHTRTGQEADIFGRELIERWADDSVAGAIPIWILSNTTPEDNLWWHTAANVQRYFLKSKVVLARLSLEIRATLGLPYGDRINHRIAG